MNAGRAIVGNTIMKWGRDDDVGQWGRVKESELTGVKVGPINNGFICRCDGA